MKVWIDADTGTWGDIDELYLVEVDYEQSDGSDFGDLMDEMTDDERGEYARKHGVKCSP